VNFGGKPDVAGSAAATTPVTARILGKPGYQEGHTAKEFAGSRPDRQQGMSNGASGYQDGYYSDARRARRWAT
jgi:hypothetical protein